MYSYSTCNRDSSKAIFKTGSPSLDQNFNSLMINRKTKPTDILTSKNTKGGLIKKHFKASIALGHYSNYILHHEQQVSLNLCCYPNPPFPLPRVY